MGMEAPQQDIQKEMAAEAALDFVSAGDVIGIGTGSTTNFFIDSLVKIKSKIDAAVASSEVSAERLRAVGIRVIDLNHAGELPLYVDSADEATSNGYLIKGGGGALTREKIVASACGKFVCIIDTSKLCGILGSFPLPIEVIPMAQGLVSRRLVQMGGTPVVRERFQTDNGNIVIDVRNLDLTDPLRVEQELNCVAGVVENGIFGRQSADVLLVGGDNDVRQLNL
ncbi:MAG: ribose 5-phosphate isomerase A [Acidiferrobacteraceae bacterium]|nr:ribose 5-phosphate isomerase A [Acidiferrobacteraceae bacterium]|tara:strand:+ start:1260 stop:1934 length:675 start_codon:yes stop_codon:yes gene_type:complete